MRKTATMAKSKKTTEHTIMAASILGLSEVSPLLGSLTDLLVGLTVSVEYLLAVDDFSTYVLRDVSVLGDVALVVVELKVRLIFIISRVQV